MSDQFDYKKLDSIIHSKIRLAIVSFLFRIDEAEFNELKDKLKTSDGNLSVHLSKLEDSKYIKIKKGYKGKIPCTKCSLTERGKMAFKEYIKVLESIIINKNEVTTEHKSIL